jgi:MarR family 2-MHQ and catechol resistance regulon transcriptional repressor
MPMPTHHVGSEEEVLALDTFIKLTRASDAVMGRLSHAQTLEDLTITQFGVLETVYHLGPMSQREIGDKLLKSGGNMTLVIDNLCKRGLVTRTRSTEDRRVMLISLTEEGLTAISRIFPAHAKVITREMNALTPDEQRELGRLCKKLGLGSASTGSADAASTDSADGASTG